MPGTEGTSPDELVFAQLAPDHIDRFVVQGHRDRLARLRLVGMNPGDASRTPPPV
jgi:hypothetical protein